MPQRIVLSLVLLCTLALAASAAPARASDFAASTSVALLGTSRPGRLMSMPVLLGAAEAENESQPLVPNPTDAQTWWEAAWVMIIFIILLIILYPTAWRSVLNGLKAREQRIRTDIAQAEAARAKAESSLKEYNNQLAHAEERSRALITQATGEGERLAAQIRTHAQQEAEETRERTLRDIEAARTQALADIYQQTASLATLVAEKILRRNLNPDDQRDLVAQSLEQIQSVGKN